MINVKNKIAVKYLHKIEWSCSEREQGRMCGDLVFSCKTLLFPVIKEPAVFLRARGRSTTWKFLCSYVSRLEKRTTMCFYVDGGYNDPSLSFSRVIQSFDFLRRLKRVPFERHSSLNPILHHLVPTSEGNRWNRWYHFVIGYRNISVFRFLLLVFRRLKTEEENGSSALKVNSRSLLGYDASVHLAKLHTALYFSTRKLNFVSTVSSLIDRN